MEDGLLSLKWNNHKTTFFEILKLLRDKANYTDATLAVEGKFYPVHKLVLSTCSEYFSEIFERTPCKSPVIVLKDVRSQDLESLLDYMYLGEVNVNQNDLALLLKTAECLRIKGLAVPDDDPTKHSSASSVHNKTHSLNKDDAVKDAPVKDAPPSKRRREDTSSASSALSPPRVSPATKIPASPSHTSSSSHPHKTSAEACSPRHDPEHHDTAMVKVEMEEIDGGDDTFPSDNCDSNVDPENKEYIEKAEHDPSSYPNANFSTQHTGDMQWEEDGENSFPQESFGGDSSSQQAGGARTGMEPLGMVQVALSPGGGSKERVMMMSLLNLQMNPEDDDDPFDLDDQDKPITLPHNLQAQPVGDYPCIYCGKFFFYPSSLEKHIRTHTGEKPFKCTHCAYCASQKSHLKTHVLRKHNVTLGSDEEKGDKEKD